MLVQLPRLTGALRGHYDIDEAYLRRKTLLQNLKWRRSNDDSELAKKLVPNWEEASSDVRQAYRQFLGALAEINSEMVSEEFRQVAKAVYDLFSSSDIVDDEIRVISPEKRSEMQRLVGYRITDVSIQKVASLAHKLYTLQHVKNEAQVMSIDTSGSQDSSFEFGSDLNFNTPSRFLVDVSLEDNDAFQTGLYNNQHMSQNHYSTDKRGSVNLRWLKDACDRIAGCDGSQLSGDDLSMALSRVLILNKQGDEIAGDLLDLVGDSAFDMVQDILSHRKELVSAIQHGLHILKSENTTSTGQSKMPSYGTQVTIQTESEKQVDKLRRKEEKRNKRVAETGATDGLAVADSFISLLLASERKQPFDDVIGTGEQNSLSITALPKGTSRSNYPGYEEVKIPAVLTSAMRSDEKLIEIKELDEFAQAAFQGYKTLNRIQSRIYHATYNTNENILVCAPTGAGKTNIAMIAILHEIKQHFREGILHKNEFKIVYVAPMKALAAEVTATFSRRLGPLNLLVRELTGDMQLSKNELEETQMIVTTPEKWDVITRKSSDMSLSMLVKLLIIDEVHLLNDERGPVIEALVARTLRQVESTQSMIRIVGLSATLPNYLDVAQFLRVNPSTGLFFFDSSYRPVPLAQQYIGISERDYAKRLDLFNKVCYDKVVESIKQGHQAMVFVHSRKDTGKTARTLIDMAANSEQIELFMNYDHPKFSLMKKEVSKSRNREVVEFFEAGFGIHHAGMLRSDRGLTERLFSEGLLKVLVCTATLAWGVNLPAHTVVIKGTQIYDPKAGGWRDLGMLDVMQIFGRAGRPQFDKSGEGIIITTHDKLAYYLRLLTSQLPIESQFVEMLKDNLNAEVALGTVTNIKEACAWLGYTYLFIRMKTNPLVYGIAWEEVIADPSLGAKQRSFIVDAARALDKAKMMRYDEKSGNFYCTELGRIASHYYLRYSSVETYNEMLKRHMSESEVINMVAHSSEFENIAVREEEQDELENLSRSCCPIEVKGGMVEKYGKIAILIQVFISRGSMDSFSLISDASYISASLGRIMRALFEICLRRGWCEMSSLLLDYCKAVDRQIWPHQHPLRQFDQDLSPQVIRKIEERGADLDRLYDMEEKDIGALVRYSPGGKLVKQFLSYFPYVNLSATVSPITRTVLKVDLHMTPEFIWKDRHHGTSLRWWILVEDSENDHIYHNELFTLTKKMTKGVPQKISFTVPIFEPHPPQYYIRAISDTWLQAESLFTVSFNNLTLPETQVSHTELLDLKPLPLSALRNEAYERLYRFSHFNPIQTQAFHVLYHTDTNVLLGAPTGSGKTISAELAMLHIFNTQPDMKVVYIAPLKAIVRERMNDWRQRLVSQLGKKMVEMTGDFTPDLMALLSADIIISTPEKWDGISRNWHSRSYVMKVGLMILDEIHLLGADRGPILEVIVSRMRYISSQTERTIRFVGLSTALANARDLAEWLGVEEQGLFNFKPSVRPVPLEVHIQGYPGKFYCPRMNSMNKPAYAAICTHSPAKPVLIFVSSRRQTRLTALDLIQLAASDEKPRQFLNMAENNLEMVLSQVSDSNLRHTLQFGIGLHHAGLNDKDRSLVEELFANNKIQILVCTSTLAWGVNLPAHLVIIKGTEFYDGKTKRYVDFPITDILQMMGRAGRPQFDQHGKAVILVHEPKKSFYKKFLYEPFPVESSLRECLQDHINAEIVSGTISHKEDAVHYLTWTYLFRRLVANPSYYDLENIEPHSVNSYLSRLVETTFEDLEDGGCIKVEENSVNSLMLGSIASQYYLSYRTVSMFGSKIGSNTSLEVFLDILSSASEFDELPVRHNEENYNKSLSEKVPLKVDEHHLEDPHVKANLLFQAHFSRAELPITDYVTDLKSVLDQSIRIIQAMIDICANSGWLMSTLTCMHILQMIMQGLWFERDSPLCMLPCMNSDLLSQLNRSGIFAVPDLFNRSYENVQRLLRPNNSADLYKELQYFPQIQVKLSLQKRPTGESNSTILKIKLENTNIRRSGSRSFSPRYPKVKDEAWWLVLGNVVNSELYALKRISFSDHLVTQMELPQTSCDFQEMKLILVSDCYLGFEQEHSLPTFK
ncbi:Activating signal cointegrator 1 complex subunit 3 [Rhynchospora pubera]|uniref:RNA helicase n=1 Tax=Rhynchospora pubera TaxID=906938 RepID=A0AAV8HUZ6_9POAL|nr:Activating signal cointegrator 1 complex subunit 3 [Rhynchospora pubera]